MAGPCAAAADPLPRSASLAAEVRTVTGGAARGVEVTALRGEAGVALKAGDIIVALDGKPTADVPALLAALRGTRAGNRLHVEVQRGRVRKHLWGIAAARPIERFAGAETRLGEVAFGGGLLRDIMVVPHGAPADGPLLFLIPGYTCASVETPDPDASHHQLIEGLAKRGIATYRIEKPGVGDSRGGKPCADIDFATELGGFVAGYRALVEKYGVSPDRIFLFGHSLGGIEAPLMARDLPPRGVAVYGTVYENWQDYMANVFRTQDFIALAADPALGEARGEEARALLHQVFVDRLTPGQIAAQGPEAAARLTSLMSWDGGTHYYGRHYAYWQGLAGQRMAAAWRDVHAEVLSIFGESDVEALNDIGHRAIADVVNHYRPGTARFVAVPLTGHKMRLDGTLADVRRARSGGDEEGATRPFNPALIDIVADWIARAAKR
ncbi:hypothetical protein FHS95_003987 [Sphingomonas naasensis]|uniref:AB hydrolase-1 domain-containing protein n=1 Tax=Sphingomonas naasensis TaxID=1344951 RepID=A0A4S1WGB8_9SPHN|nr:alpha/beta fold hydrolase [Sphingomonas naasensis]NIJ22272.1 hypothetical protein [Sphingomonas naasensis]TGX40717.1 hypothetical protein E5A74_14590 [Sphingomonas naasensis]